MSDYVITTDFSPKDSLPLNDPEKLILGSDLDVEFEAIVVAMDTKFDSSNIATQVQAEAGTSNAVLMTPLRTAQFLSDAGGGGAGIVNDLIALADPNADRILFWDDSENAAAFLTVSTGLTITTTNLTTNDGAIVHDNLSGFVANEHIDHSSVTLTFTEGIQWSSGGTDITASATGKLDISGLTQETTLDTTNDLIAFYDNSAAAHRKIPLTNFIGTALGDGKWYKSTTTSLSDETEITIAYNTAEYDALEKGTFSTVTGEYTVGSAATRIFISATAEVAGIEFSVLELTVQVNGTDKLKAKHLQAEGLATISMSATVSGNLNLAATDVVRVRVIVGESGSNVPSPLAAGTSLNYVSIIELG